MNRIKNNTEAKPKKKGRLGKWVTTVLNGEYLTNDGVVKHLPFVLFLSFLFICNIAWIYYSENLIRENNTIHRELDELRSEYNTVITQLESRSGQTRVAEDVKDLGLKESTTPPVVIDVDKNQLTQQP